LVLEQAVAKHHRQMEDPTNGADLTAHANQLVGVVL
jgi:hypothetical protein